MKTLDQLMSNACNYWPTELYTGVAESSPLIPLLETQDIFLSVLKTADLTPYSWVDAIKLSSILSPNLFLKHLMVLSDIGGERLQRFSKDFCQLFPTGKLTFKFKEEIYEHKFYKEDSFSHAVSACSITWNNKKLRIEKSILLENRTEFTKEMLDVCMLLLWAGDSQDKSTLPYEMLEKCIIGSMLGRPSILEKYVKERYLYVSRQTGGSTANDLGYACERYIKKKLSRLLPSSYQIGGHTLENVSQNGNNLTKFDLVVRNLISKKAIGIEISFQVTTNSVIERKSQNAQNRQNLAHEHGHKVAYIIDGSGNFQRRNAIQTILNYSDCTVNFSDDGLKELADFILSNI